MLFIFGCLKDINECWRIDNAYRNIYQNTDFRKNFVQFFKHNVQVNNKMLLLYNITLCTVFYFMF